MPIFEGSMNIILEAGQTVDDAMIIRNSSVDSEKAEYAYHDETDEEILSFLNDPLSEEEELDCN